MALSKQNRKPNNRFREMALRSLKTNQFKDTIGADLSDNEGEELQGKSTVKPDNTDFMTLVENYQLRYGCSKSEALKKISGQYPEIHRRYLSQHNPENRHLKEDQPLKVSTVHGADYMGLVKAYEVTYGCSKIDAMKKVRAQFPEAHRAFIQAANPGKQII